MTSTNCTLDIAISVRNCVVSVLKLVKTCSNCGLFLTNFNILEDSVAVVNGLRGL